MSALVLAALAVAGAAGAVGRVYLARKVVAWQAGRRPGTPALGRWPLGTMAVNFAGAFAAGLVVGATPVVPTGSAEATWPLVVGVGFLGAFTTFSSWMVESWRLLASDTDRGAGLAHVGVSIVFGIAAAAAGLALGAWSP